MKLNYLLALSCLSMALSAQTTLPAQLSEEYTTVITHSSQSLPLNGPENIIWSEDFANGIPTSWSQQGTPALSLWEYRGPNTTPSNAIGARGAFSGIVNVPPTNVPLNSTSTANGFVIFDSGFLDNAGSQPLGNGVAPSPHVGRLITNTINLSAEPNVTLSFQSFARRFFGEFHIAFSLDGGLTYLDTLEVFPVNSVPVNAGTVNGVTTTINVSSIIGGQSNVKMQFIFDGRPGNMNGNGYYHWMLDDIVLASTSSYSLKIGPYLTAPAQDLIYNQDPSYTKYGTLNSNQIVPLQGDMNIINDGTATQTNVKLSVDVVDLATNTIVSNLQSTAGCPNLLPGDTCNFNQTLTNTWTPPTANANYGLVYRAISDSMAAANAFTSPDTFFINVVDTAYALHSGRVNNFVGSASANPNIVAMGILLNLTNEDQDSVGSNQVFIDGATLNLSLQTDSTADLEFVIYDTTGFVFNSGFPAPVTPLFSRIFTLNAAAVNSNSFFDFSTNGQPLSLNTGGYFLVVNFFPNATSGIVSLANQSTPRQPGFSSVMQLADGNWFRGFTGNAYESPHITLNVAKLQCTTQRDTLNIVGCSNSSIVSPSGNYTYTQNGTYLDTVGASGNCQTFYVINTNFLAPASDSIQVQLCAANYLSPAGKLYNQSGVYQDTLTNSFGCDSIIHIQLSLDQPYVASDTIVIDTCAQQVVSPNGTLLTSSGFYTQVLSKANGCDSTLFIDLTINPLVLSVTSILNGGGLSADEVNASYQWIDCTNNNQPLPGDTNQTFAPSQNGVYAVIISKDGCVDTSDCSSITNVSLPSFSPYSFELYPNPSSGQIQLEIPTAFYGSTFKVYNLQGGLLHQGRLLKEKTQALTLNIPKGAYFLQIANESGAQSKRVLIIE